ncbi:MAG: MraZ family transcriptional regulator [Proteobacteria bacterium]|jgi:MraZ protein|nr:MraZ family transcriptional regulator [Alphaproteobacteria bacterium]NCC02837.1 MraZ family transcriptional regulator [Pseudomonadota bacterium]
MAVFLSTFVNKIDKKGRVSVPASFRAALGGGMGGDSSGIVIFKSLQYEALDGCSIAHLELLSESLEKLDLPPETLELIETTIFGGSVQVPFDGEGRVILPAHLTQAVGIENEIAFVGRRKTFQLWNPAKLAAHDKSARTAARAKDISLSKIIAAASMKIEGSAA